MGLLGNFGGGLAFMGAFLPGYGTLAATAGGVLQAIDGPDDESRTVLPSGDLWKPGGLAWGLPWYTFPELAGWKTGEGSPTIAELVGPLWSPAFQAAREERGPWGGVGLVVPPYGSAGEALRRRSPHHFDAFDTYLVEEKQPGSSSTYRPRRRSWELGTSRAAHT